MIRVCSKSEKSLRHLLIRALPAFLGFALLSGLVPSTARAGSGPGTIAELQPRLLPLDRIGFWQSPVVEVDRLLAQDEANRDVPGIPYRVGYPMRTDLSPGNSGTWEDLPEGGQVWRLRVLTEGALWTVLGFDTFRLQRGGELRVYDPRIETVMGPYTARDIRKHGQLWFPPIAGPELVVEVYWPEELRDEAPDLHLGTVSHGYKGFGAIGRGVAPSSTPGDDEVATLGVDDSGTCNIDVACDLGLAWQDEKRSVVLLLSGGSGFCSGSLINTTADDCRPYVLTASHCSPGPSTTFGFNFEKPECGAGTPPPPTNQTVTGSTVLADYSGSDFNLLELDLAPPEEFDVYYNGWSRDTLPASESFGIHHPSGDVKKISHNFDPLVDGQNYGPNHWRVTEWEEGTTEGGSSGSPMFDQNHRIVGQLHGGTASCSSLTWDEYGKIDASWEGGSTPSTRLRDWLDPDATGAILIDGVDWSTCAIQLAGTVNLNRDLYSCSDLLDVSLRDDHLTGQANHDVTVSSTTETVAETVTLTSIDGNTGRFAGVFPVAPGAPVQGDGLLSLSHGDMIVVEYVDADDGMGGTNVVAQATALADCLPPAIASVGAGGVTGSTAMISWTTDEAADSVVMHGPAPGGGTTVTDGTLVPAHSVRLQGLAECSVHYFAVGSTDLAGNGTIDDNAGAWFTFETSRNVAPEYVSTDTPIAIPDADPAGTKSVIAVTDDKTVLDVDLLVEIAHTFTGDLTLQLLTPGGQTIALANRRGGSGDNFAGTLFDDEALVPIADGTAPFSESFQPDGLLAAADGINANGNWELRVVDNAGSDTGTIVSWTLMLTYPGEACGPHAAYELHELVTDSCPSGGPGDGNASWDVGELVQFSLTLRNDGTDQLTGLSARVVPLTPGVVLVDDQAVFPDLATGFAVTSAAPHFTALLPETLACADSVRFDLDITSAQGAWTSAFAQTIGLVNPGGGIALNEDFETGIPVSWTIADGLGDGQTWYEDNATDPANCSNADPAPPVAGSWAAVDSDCALSVPMDEELISPPIDLSTARTVAVEFDHYFNRYQTEIADVDVWSSLTGGAWVNVARFIADTTNPQHETLDLTTWAAGVSDAQVRFRYYDAEFDWYWYVDNVVVSFTEAGSCEMAVCTASPGAPQPVPQLLANRADAAGAQILVSWDNQCAPTTAKIIYGPLDQVSSHAVTGSRCAIANPELWDPAPGESVWFVVVGEDGAGVESSWGSGSYGERNSLVASGTCGSTVKDITAICP